MTPKPPDNVNNPKTSINQGLRGSYVRTGARRTERTLRCVCMRACVHVCERVYVCVACVHVYEHVYACV
jgi:hypothetical protein